MATKEQTLAAERRNKTILSVVLTVVCIIYCLPVVAVLINSFKANTFVKTETFALPTEQSFVGFDNFVTGMTFGNYPFANSVMYSVIITVRSVALILIFCSMAAASSISSGMDLTNPTNMKIARPAPKPR